MCPVWQHRSELDDWCRFKGDIGIYLDDFNNFENSDKEYFTIALFFDIITLTKKIRGILPLCSGIIVISSNK